MKSSLDVADGVLTCNRMVWWVFLICIWKEARMFGSILYCEWTNSRYGLQQGEMWKRSEMTFSNQVNGHPTHRHLWDLAEKLLEPLMLIFNNSYSSGASRWMRALPKCFPYFEKVKGRILVQQLILQSIIIRLSSLIEPGGGPLQNNRAVNLGFLQQITGH